MTAWGRGTLLEHGTIHREAVPSASSHRFHLPPSAMVEEPPPITLAAQGSWGVMFFRARLDSPYEIKVAMRKAKAKLKKLGLLTAENHDTLEFHTSPQRARDIMVEMGQAYLSDSTEDVDSDCAEQRQRRDPEREAEKIARVEQFAAQGQTLLLQVPEGAAAQPPVTSTGPPRRQRGRRKPR